MDFKELMLEQKRLILDKSTILDKSHILASKDNDVIEEDLQGTFQANIITIAKRIFTNKVNFGLNRIRKEKQLFDTRYWVAKGESALEMKENTQPYKALLSIINNTSGNQTLDCAQYVQVVYLGAILLTDGESNFDKYIGKKFVLFSYGSTGIERKTIYSRGRVNEKFAIDDSLDKLTDSTQEQLLRSAPIGSRVTVQNFSIAEHSRSPDETKKKFALGITARGWEMENMIKIGEDSYAAFGVGYGVNLGTVKKGLVDEYYGVGRYKKEDADALLKWISISQIEHFKRK
jgi:Protein-glutamine gamma-glutamyltransferase